MVRNEDFFLRKWIEYYAGQLGRENLYICFDGEDQEIPEFTAGCNIKVFNHVTENVTAGDKRRAALLSDEASELSKKYDFIIGTDVDEFLIVDPALKMTLPEFLSRNRKYQCISGLGIDVGMDITAESSLESDKPILSQRKYALVHSRYTKASVIRGNLTWGSGFHRVKGKNYHILRGLYLFHFGGCDISRLIDKKQDNELKESGWSRHLDKRLSTIRQIETAAYKNQIKEWESIINLCRVSQTLFRPLFAWNKPTMFGNKPVVRIPERFKSIV